MHDQFTEHHSSGRPGHRRRGHRRGPGGHGHGRHRARRGAVGVAILSLLDERPMHGYDLINEFETRSEGRWRPSPGTMYPALERLEEAGFITAADVDGKRQFSLTERGRTRVEEHRESGDDAPWRQHGLGRHGDFRKIVAELGGQARQIGRFGTPEQVELAKQAIQATTRRLYEILATAPAEDGAGDLTGDD